MAYKSKLIIDKVVTTLSDLPTPSGGLIQLADNITYRFKGLVNIGTNQIVLGASNTLYGNDKSDDGIVYTGTASAIIGTNRTVSISSMTLASPSGKTFSITNSLSFSSQIRECIISGASVGEMNGGLLFAFNNNIVGDSGDLVVSGTFQKVGIATNYWVGTTYGTRRIYFNGMTADTVKAIDNDFLVPSGKIGIGVNAVTITNQGGGSIISNTFSGTGTYIQGIDTATLEWIIEANGRDVLSTSEVVTQKKVRSEAELQQYLALPDPTIYSYLLDAKDFVITQPIVVPSGGVNGGLTFFGLGNNFTTISTATPGMAMFTGGGNLFLNDMIISATGAGSSVFGMTSSTGFEAVEMLNLNFQFCESLGYLDGFRQGLIINGFMIGDKQGLEFRGTWSGGFRISDSRFIFTPTVGSYMFKGAVGQTFGNRFISNANSTIGTGSVGYEFTEANFVRDADFQLIEANFGGGGTPVSGITASSRKSLWRDCVGVDDTFQGVWYRNTIDTITDIVSPGVYVELAINVSVLEDVWWESQSSSVFHAKYLVSNPNNFRIELLLALQSGNNNELEIEIRKYDSTNTTFEVRDNFKMTSNGGTLGTRVEPIILVTFARMNQDERIRVFVRNNSANTDVLAETSSKMIISKR